MGVFGKRDKIGERKRNATNAASTSQSMPTPHMAQPMALALEPRFMFDAAGAATAVDIAQQTAADSLADAATSDATAPTADAQTATNTLVVVDTSVAGYSTLIEGLAPGAEVLKIGADQNGLQVLADALAAGGTTYDAIHVVSHGGEGQVQLGTTLLTSESLTNYGDALSALGAALTADGDLLLYGCEVGTGTGQAFVDELATQTGADVAASDDLTGAADLGGDWDLEVITGSIEADLPFSDRAMADFTGVLALPADNTTFAMTAAGGWTDAGNSLTHNYFTATGSDTIVGTAVDPKLSASGSYFATGGQNAIGTWTVTADGTNVATFQLTTVVARDYYATSNFDTVYIKGYVSGGGTILSTTKNGTDGVQDVFTFSGADMTNFSGVNLTSFKIFYSEADVGSVGSGDFEFQSFTTTLATAPSSDATITSATYDTSNGNLAVTGTNLTATGGAANDVVANKITLTGEGGQTYTLTDTANVEISSATGFTLVLSATDKAALNQIMNKNGTASTSATTYDVDGAAGFIAAQAAIADTGVNGVTVSNVSAPTITSAAYNATTGALTVTGTGLTKFTGATNDIDVSKLTFAGEGGATYTLTSATDVEITDGTSFTVTLNAADKAALNQIMNKDGTASTSATTYNIAGAEDWAKGADAAVNVADLTGNAVTVSSVPAPTITSATYNVSTGALVVTGTNFTKSAASDIDLTKLTFTGAGTTYTLTSTAGAEITDGTSFSVTLNATDKAALNLITNSAGTASTNGTAYNLAAAEDWAKGAAASVTVADLTGNGLTVSVVPTPAITSATYNASTGALVVTGTGFTTFAGATNDIDLTKLTFTGAGTTYTLTSATGPEVTDSTSFSVTLNATDKAALNTIMNKDGGFSTNNAAYNLAAAEDWARGAATSVTIADLTSNGIDVSNVPVPTITSAAYDYNSNVLTVTGTGFLKRDGATNDIDISKLTFTGEGGATYALTSASDVEITNGTTFSVTLAGADLTNVEALLNKDGATANSGTTYNLNAAEDWAVGADAAVNVVDATGNGITVSNFAAPTVTSATYDVATGALVVTGTNFVNASGATNDITANLLTLTGEGGSYTLTDTANVEVTSATAFTLTLSATDKLNIDGLLNKNVLTSSGGTTYNLAAADNWMAGTPAALSIADATGNGVTVSNVATPTITSATYDSDTGTVSVTGANLFKKVGAANDIDISTLTFTGGTGNATYTVTSATDIEITSATAFSFTLSGADKTNVDALLDQIGTSSSGGSTYNIAGADNWLTGADAATNIADATNAVTVSINPKLTSATYNASTGSLVVTGTNIQANGGGADIDASMLTLTGEGGATYTLTDTADVERTNVSSFTLTLSATDKAALNQIMNKDGTSSTGTTTYNVAAADNWNTNVTAGDTSDATGNGVTVSSVAVPSITSSTYDANTGTLVVTGTGFTKFSGATNDIDVSKFTFTGAGTTYTLTSATDVEITSGTTFTLTLSAADKAGLNLIMNKNSTSSTDTVAYNLNAAEDWARGADAAVNVVDATGNGVTVSNVAVPTIASSTYDASTGSLVVTGTGFLSKSGATNDIVANKFTFTGEGGATYTLTDSSNVEVTSGTAFTVTLSATDKAALNLIMNKNGTSATSTTTYNLNAAEDWAAGADAAVNVVDATGNGVTVSNVATPAITSSTYDATTGALVVTGAGFTNATGGANDIDVSKFTFTGEGGSTYTLTSATDIEITSGTSFTITLSGADKLAVNGLLNKNGTTSDGATTYNLAAAEDWARGADAAVNVVDATGNAVTVSNYAAPTITSATYDANTNQLVVTGTNFVSKSGATNDVDISLLTFTGEGGGTYTLTSATDVEITSATSFTVTLSGTDMLAVEGLLNKNGTTSDGATTYNLAAADNWMAAGPASVDIADATANAVTVSNNTAPSITSTAYDISTGILTVTGSNFVSKLGAANDVDVSTFTFTGEGGATYTLTSATDIEVTSPTSFTITLSGADRLSVAGLLNKDGTQSDGTTVYNIAAADNWMTAAAASVNVADATNAVTAGNYAAPTITSAAFDGTSGVVTVTGTGFVSKLGAANDVDLSTLTFTGKAGATYTLTTATDVEVTSATSYSFTLSGTDKTEVLALLDKDGTVANDSTTYNFAGADNWMAAAAATVNIADATNGVTVSNTSAPPTVSTSTGLNTGQQPPSGGTPSPPPSGDGVSGGPGDNTTPPLVNPIPGPPNPGRPSGPSENVIGNEGTYINDASISDPGGVDVLSIVGNSVGGHSNLIDSFYGAGRTDTTTRSGDAGTAGPAGGAGGFSALAGNSVMNGIGGFGGVGGPGQGFGDANGNGFFNEGQGNGQGEQNGQGGPGAPGQPGLPGPGADLRPTGRAGFSDQLAQAADGFATDMSLLAAAVEQAKEAPAV